MKILTILILLFPTSLAQAQTIADKKFIKTNAPIFLFDGFSNFSAAFPNEKSNFEQKNSLVVGNDSQIFFRTGIKTSNQAKYGAIAKIEFNFNTANSTKKNENPNLDQAFLFAENSLGKFELGNFQAVNQKMKTGAAKLARGAGGINGKYLENVNLPNSSFILLAQSPIGHGSFARGDYLNFNRTSFRALKDDSFDGVEDAAKISYYTPRIEGVQIGASYTPNSSNSGFTSTKYYNSKAIKIINIASFGANYSQDFDNLGLEISTTAEQGKVKNYDAQNRSNLFSYDFGATLSYFGFSVGASYGDWKKSLQQKNVAQKNGNSQYSTAAISYAFGPIATSLTALKSTFEKNNYQAISLGVDYKLARDLMPYFEVTKFAFKSASNSVTNSNIKDNQGYIFLTGVLISF